MMATMSETRPLDMIARAITWVPFVVLGVAIVALFALPTWLVVTGAPRAWLVVAIFYGGPAFFVAFVWASRRTHRP